MQSTQKGASRKCFTSDLQLHFFHKNICKFTDRHKFTNADDHTEWLINLWNRDVESSEEVFHLGDFAFSSKYELVRDIVKQLNGHKTFIKGNHCDPKVMRRLVDEGYINAFYDYKEIKIGDQAVCLFHFPMMAWHKQGYGSWHLFGHSHGNLTGARGKMLDVGLDSSYNLYGTHRFFSEFDVLNYMARQELVITDHHKER